MVRWRKEYVAIFLSSLARIVTNLFLSVVEMRSKTQSFQIEEKGNIKKFYKYAI